MGLKQNFFKQFSKPEGMLGHLAGWIMGSKNRPRIRWGIEKLQPEADHQVLEIGYGPGLFVECMIDEQNHSGAIHGIDISEVMLNQASKRNKKAIANKQVQLQIASVEKIPFADSTFDRIYTSNTNMFWPEPIESFKEIRRVLKDEGRFVLSLQPRWLKEDEQIKAEAEKIKQQMMEAGFQIIDTDFKAMQPMMCLAITAS
jgi:SAM-dependent methyltransferase